ncbi:hypothetical protein CVT24_000428 [Panaeolus cyanescens]|uniref:AB hydrolase-1 domain-containing protein n=1 Tax=Panaeolus cyanescens TaxID=181874 RepID=A0A409W743_9AGAR|nr:hypothetical protein CVT24_000428 [Panaeolus cyanescens]
MASFLLVTIISLLLGPLQCSAGDLNTPHRQDYFYVGGSYVETSPGTTIKVGQMYVEHLSPLGPVRKYPIVIIPGNGMTVTNFFNTPDGRLGWADYLLGQGYELFLVDQPGRGRSPWHQGIDGPQSTFSTQTIEQRFTAAQRFNLWPQAHLHTQWPGNGSMNDPTFDNFYTSIVPAISSAVESSKKVQDAGVLLLEKIARPSILITHSQSGQFGWPLADARPSLVKAIVAIEPIGPPFTNAVFPPNVPARPFGLTEIPMTFSPSITTASDLDVVLVSSDAFSQCFQQRSPARKLVNLAKIPVLVVTSESSYHAVYDECSVRFLREAGVEVDFVELGKVGIKGNGHMMFMEKNNLDIMNRVIGPWLTKVGK